MKTQTKQKEFEKVVEGSSGLLSLLGFFSLAVIGYTILTEDYLWVMLINGICLIIIAIIWSEYEKNREPRRVYYREIK